MNARLVLLAPIFCLIHGAAVAQTTNAAVPRAITLPEAVDLALQHNHVVRLAALKVSEQEEVKAVAKSAYFPSVRADSNFVRVTDTQLIEIPVGGFGSIAGTPIPQDTLILNQGGKTFSSVGAGVVQPLTQLLKIRAANDVASAGIQAARGKARGIENEIALKVHQLFYRVLVAEARRGALLAKVSASEDLQQERVQQVKFGSVLDSDLIESRAQSLQARQELLTTELQLSDLHMQFNDLVGLPLGTAVSLDPSVTGEPDPCRREECVTIALESHPEVAEARAVVEKTEAAVRAARYDFLPDVEAFARYSVQDNMPFLATNFGTVGIRLSYDVFEGGRKSATLRERNAQLAQARENLARIKDEVELRVATAYNKLERTRQMVAVSQELLALRAESRRVVAEQLTHGAALRSLAGASVAQELEAKAMLLQSRLDYVQAADEMDEAVGRTPR
jgi:outer membrane protein TolC